MKSTLLSKPFQSLITSAVVFLAASAGADIPAFVLGSVVTNRPLSFTGTRGWQFGHGGPNSSTQDILITQLGVFDNGGDGLVNAHPIGLWQAGNVTGTLLASATVPAGAEAPLVGGYRWVSITPVRIPYAVGAYVVAAQYSAGDADDLVTPRPPGTVGNFQFARDISVFQLAGRGAFGNDLPYPAAFWSCGEGCLPEIFWEPNFQYVVVPEPAIWLLLSPGLLCLLLRLRRSV